MTQRSLQVRTWLSDSPRARRCTGAALSLLCGLVLCCAAATARGQTFAQIVQDVQPRIVKIYGAGGLKGLEAYQSGFLISAEGHILTVWSYVLDTDFITVTLDDGRKFQAEVMGADPHLEIAILKVDGQDLAHFAMDKTTTLAPGNRVLAFSNLFKIATGDESASVLHGNVSVVAPLRARRGAYQSAYQGEVYVLDAMTNNPGAAGGALTDRSGNIAGMLGKELRNSLDNTWLNYALPVSALSTSVRDILAGKTPQKRPDDVKKPLQPLTLQLLGIDLVPDVLIKTPPYVDRVRPGSAADKADIRPDDLILFVDTRIASSCKMVREELSYIDRIDQVQLTIQRDQQLLVIELSAE